MKREAVNYFSVGLFVLTGLALFLYLLFRISDGAGDKDVYYTNYRNVAGLSSGTQVTYEGFSLGHVAAIKPQRNDQGISYQVELRVSRDWKIPEDSVARIHSNGLLAETVVDISEGSSGRFLDAGATLRGDQGADLFAALGEIAGGFGELKKNGIEPLLATLHKTALELDGELGKRVPLILDDVDSLVAKLDSSANHLGGILNAETELKAQRIINNVDHASADFRSLTASLAEVKDAASGLVIKLDSMVGQAKPELQQSIQELRSVMERVSRYSDGILHNLDSTSRNMSEFSRQIRENPGRLIGGAVSGDPGVRRD